VWKLKTWCGQDQTPVGDCPLIDQQQEYAPMTIVETVKARETRIREELAQDGYVLLKSSARKWSLDNRLGYAVENVNHRGLDFGWHYDATLDEIEEWMHAVN
jgi:hypothetical protein